MRKPTNPIILIAMAFGIVICAATFGRTVRAALPQEVTDAVEVIKKTNQPVIAENRPEHELFEAAKADNEKQIGIMRKHGYDLDWSTMEPIPFQSGKAPAPKKEVRGTVYQWKDAPEYK